jgi:hypothetical protein
MLKIKHAEKVANVSRLNFLKDIKLNAEKYQNICSGSSGLLTLIILAIIGAPDWFIKNVS